jgi:cytochrome c553
MKRYSIITGCVVVAALMSCNNSHRNPGRAYMPDMTYSPAYETYAPAQERLKASGAEGEAHYTGQPVAGTVAIGDELPFHLPNDSIGYRQSAAINNPLDRGTINMKEAERLYLVNCGICHGSKLDGNGPLYKDGNGPFSAAPKNLMGDDMKALSEGTIFHVVTFGKGQMGSYASQLTAKQRWEVIAYVKGKQFPAGAAAADSTTKPAANADSASVAQKK